MKQQIYFWSFVLWLAGSVFLPACSKTPGNDLPLAVSKISYPDARFLVLSDLHFYDTTLGTSGTAFQAYMNRDRKLLAQSCEILETAVKKMTGEAADFILVSGDLTKDGEAVCHRGVTRRLRPLLASGKKVIVVPGNHDISNPESLRYTGDKTQPEPSISPSEFEQIYGDFGYNGALARDSHSLSYVTEPVKGLWILALDSNRYRENHPGEEPVVGGALSDGTLAWIESQLAEAQKKHKAVIAVLHHGIMEHYPANERFYSQYLLDDHETVSTLLASYGVRMTFTGHFHAQDITYTDIPLNKTLAHRLFDIETGSLVTAPCPYRRVGISGGKARIDSEFITAIPSMGDAFKAHAADNVFNGTVRLANAKLTHFKVSKTEQPKISRQISAAYVTHLAGDEVRPEKPIDTEGFGLWLRFIAWYQKDLIEGWVTDLPPSDNALTIDLATGAVE